MLRRLLREHIPAGATRLAVLDIHTGLGPCGYGEPIYADDSPKGFKRARRWVWAGADPDHGLHGGEPHGAKVSGQKVSGLKAVSLGGASPLPQPCPGLWWRPLMIWIRPLR